MRIENNYQQQTFGRAYLDMRSLNRYGYGKNIIIEALKERNTPLRRFIKEVINTKEFEKDMGDCFISCKRQRFFGEGGYGFHTINIRFPKRDKIYIANGIKDDKSFYTGFSQNEVQDGVEELAEYITGKEIVKDLKEHIKELQNK